MALDETFANLAAFLNSLDAEGEQKFELSHSLVIICPDCGKNIAFRGRCPKCAGNSWIPAGHAGGIFERTKAQRLRRMIAHDDDSMGGNEPPPIAVAAEVATDTGAPVTPRNGQQRKKRNKQQNEETIAPENGDEAADRS